MKEDVKKVLKAFGVWFYMPVPSPLGRAGIHDFMCIMPWDGRTLTVETKAPGKVANATANQLKFAAEVRDAGGEALITDNADALRTLLNACRQKAQETRTSR